MWIFHGQCAAQLSGPGAPAGPLEHAPGRSARVCGPDRRARAPRATPGTQTISPPDSSSGTASRASRGTLRVHQDVLELARTDAGQMDAIARPARAHGRSAAEARRRRRPASHGSPGRAVAADPAPAADSVRRQRRRPRRRRCRPARSAMRERPRRRRATRAADEPLALAQHPAPTRAAPTTPAPRAAREVEHALDLLAGHARPRAGLEPAPHDPPPERRRLRRRPPRRSAGVVQQGTAARSRRQRVQQVVLVAQPRRPGPRGRAPRRGIELGRQERQHEPAHAVARMAQVGVAAIEREAARRARPGSAARRPGSRRAAAAAAGRAPRRMPASPPRPAPRSRRSSTVSAWSSAVCPSTMREAPHSAAIAASARRRARRARASRPAPGATASRRSTQRHAERRGQARDHVAIGRARRRRGARGRRAPPSPASRCAGCERRQRQRAAPSSRGHRTPPPGGARRRGGGGRRRQRVRDGPQHRRPATSNRVAVAHRSACATARARSRASPRLLATELTHSGGSVRARVDRGQRPGAARAPPAAPGRRCLRRRCAASPRSTSRCARAKRRCTDAGSSTPGAARQPAVEHAADRLDALQRRELTARLRRAHILGAGVAVVADERRPGGAGARRGRSRRRCRPCRRDTACRPAAGTPATQPPRAGSQVSTPLHGLPSSHDTGAWTQRPRSQRSVVHGSPSSHARLRRGTRGAGPR